MIYCFQLSALVKLFGDSGKMNGSKILKKFVFEVIDKGLMKTMTWTGKTNVRDVRKLALNKYTLLLKLIHETVLKADSTYTYKQFQSDIVNKVVKYAYSSTEENASG